MRQFRPRLISAISCGLAIALYTVPIQAQSPLKSGEVRVSGKQLKRDGKPWIPHGFYQIPFEVPPGAFTPQSPWWSGAYDSWSPDEYQQMKAQGADSVRLQIAQDGADPEDSKYFDPTWLAQAIYAIFVARANGLTVFVSIQAESQTGEPMPPLPNDATRRVWKELAPIFSRDRGVVYELYNEPSLGNTHPDEAPTADQWQAWQVAMNETIDVVRGAGAENVVLADALAGGQQLSGAPQLTDPLHQVAYAVHPYAFKAYDQTKAAWDEKFGDFSKNAPVIVSEWSIGYYSDPNTPAAVVTFLQYLQNHGIGLEAGIWDWPLLTFRSIREGFPTLPDGPFSTFLDDAGAPTRYEGPNVGPGLTVESWYLTGVPPTAPL